MCMYAAAGANIPALIVIDLGSSIVIRLLNALLQATEAVPLSPHHFAECHYE